VEATWKSSINAWPELYFLNQEAWAILLDSKANQSDFVKANQWYHVLVSKLPKKVPIASFVSEAMMRVYAKSGNIEKAVELFESLKISAKDFHSSFSGIGIDGNESNRFDQCLHTYHDLIQVSFDTDNDQIALDYFYKCLEFCRAVDCINKVMSRPPPPSNQSSLEEYPARETGYLPHLKNQHPNPETVSVVLEYLYRKKEYDQLLQWHHYFQYYVRLSDRARQDVVRAYLELDQRELAIREWKRIVGGYIIADEDLQVTMNRVIQETEEELDFFS
jgi:pentatricopeptide repeat protein